MHNTIRQLQRFTLLLLPGFFLVAASILLTTLLFYPTGPNLSRLEPSPVRLSQEPWLSNANIQLEKLVVDALRQLQTELDALTRMLSDNREPAFVTQQPLWKPLPPPSAAESHTFRPRLIQL